MLLCHAHSLYLWSNQKNLQFLFIQELMHLLGVHSDD